jgi:TrmH family RNA methyltransferase
MLTKNQIKYIQSLGQKKCRDLEEVFIGEGPRLVDEMLRNKKCHVRHIYAVGEWIAANKDVVADEVTEITPDELQKISQMKTPHEVLILVNKLRWKGKIALTGKITLVLDGIQDPGNLGTIIRTADWFGITQVVCSPECADLYNPKVVQATMGSITRVRVEYEDLYSFLQTNPGIPVYAACMEGENVKNIKKLEEGLIIIGNEARGISQELMGLSHTKITIRGTGDAESLNAAIATGIILSQVCNS